MTWFTRPKVQLRPKVPCERVGLELVITQSLLQVVDEWSALNDKYNSAACQWKEKLGQYNTAKQVGTMYCL